MIVRAAMRGLNRPSAVISNLRRCNSTVRRFGTANGAGSVAIVPASGAAVSTNTRVHAFATELSAFLQLPALESSPHAASVPASSAAGDIALAKAYDYVVCVEPASDDAAARTLEPTIAVRDYRALSALVRASTDTPPAAAASASPLLTADAPAAKPHRKERERSTSQPQKIANASSHVSTIRIDPFPSPRVLCDQQKWNHLSPLISACHIHDKYKRTGEMTRILDATAGLGGDAWCLASVPSVPATAPRSLTHQLTSSTDAAVGLPRVTAVEQNRVLFRLIQNALTRAAASPEHSHPASRMQVVCADSVVFMESLLAASASASASPNAARRPHVVYIDTFYPARANRSKTQPKKAMHFAKFIAKQQTDDELTSGFAALLSVARLTALHKVVVKRPVFAPRAAPDVTKSLTSRDTRYDIIDVRGSTGSVIS